MKKYSRRIGISTELIGWDCLVLRIIYWWYSTNCVNFFFRSKWILSEGKKIKIIIVPVASFCYLTNIVRLNYSFSFLVSDNIFQTIFASFVPGLSSSCCCCVLKRRYNKARIIITQLDNIPSCVVHFLAFWFFISIFFFHPI